MVILNINSVAFTQPDRILTIKNPDGIVEMEDPEYLNLHLSNYDYDVYLWTTNYKYKVGVDSKGETVVTWQDSRGRQVNMYFQNLEIVKKKKIEGYNCLILKHISPNKSSFFREIRNIGNGKREEIKYTDEYIIVDEIDNNGSGTRTEMYKGRICFDEKYGFFSNDYDGDCYEIRTGVIKDKKRTGNYEVQFFSEDDKIILYGEIPYENDKREGIVKYFYKKGILIRNVSYTSGIHNGLCEYYYPNGNLAEKWHATEGKYNGIYQTYSINGSLADSGLYNNGIKTGLWKEERDIVYYENGEKFYYSEAIKEGNISIIEQFLNSGHKDIYISINWYSDYYGHPIFKAILANKLDVIKFFVKKGVSLALISDSRSYIDFDTYIPFEMVSTNYFEFTPLFWAAQLAKHQDKDEIYNYLTSGYIADCPKGCIEGDCKNGTGRYNYENGVMYWGKFKNGLMDGYGAYYYKGAGYFGTFKNGRFNGVGSYIFYSDGSCLSGNFHSGQPTEGTLIDSDGKTLYVGEFSDWKRNGKGILLTGLDCSSCRVNSTIGIWKDNKFVSTDNSVIKEFIIGHRAYNFIIVFNDSKYFPWHNTDRYQHPYSDDEYQIPVINQSSKTMDLNIPSNFARTLGSMKLKMYHSESSYNMESNNRFEIFKVNVSNGEYLMLESFISKRDNKAYDLPEVLRLYSSPMISDFRQGYTSYYLPYETYNKQVNCASKKFITNFNFLSPLKRKAYSDYYRNLFEKYNNE